MSLVQLAQRDRLVLRVRKVIMALLGHKVYRVYRANKV
jgi:hypothetical protein